MMKSIPLPTIVLGAITAMVMYYLVTPQYVKSDGRVQTNFAGSRYRRAA